MYIFLYVGGMSRVLGPSFYVVMLTIRMMMVTTMMTMAMTPNMPQPPGGGGEKWGGRMSLCEDGPAGTFVFALLSIVDFFANPKNKT